MFKNLQRKSSLSFVEGIIFRVSNKTPLIRNPLPLPTKTQQCNMRLLTGNLFISNCCKVICFDPFFSPFLMWTFSKTLFNEPSTIIPNRKVNKWSVSCEIYTFVWMNLLILWPEKTKQYLTLISQSFCSKTWNKWSK